jgi:hypothetical protein
MAHLQGRITGAVSYREGDGMMLQIPPGLCEIEVDAIDVTIAWIEDGVHGSTAIPRGDYDEHIASGAIVFD